MEIFEGLRDLTDFKALIIRLASPDDIRRWSRGEVTKPETINYRTLKPEKDGLFDERIFGPTKDWECYCGKYKRIRYKGVVCDKCGVEVTQSRVRRERMGHIALASSVVHVWFFKGAPSRLSLILDVPPRAIEQVIYFARYLVLEIEEKKKKDSIEAVDKARIERQKELKETYDARIEELKSKSDQEKVKAEKKIKNKEQLSLAVSEIELEERKKETTLLEEKKTTTLRTDELFEGLISLIKGLKRFSILSEEEYDQLSAYGAANFFETKMGADAVMAAIEKVNLEELTANLRTEINDSKGVSAKYIKLAKRLKLVDGMRRAKVSPAWMILKVLPVLPPDLRPMVQLSGGRFATSDLNDLYRRVINRNNRLKHLIGLGAPEIILRNEKRMLQESVDSLIDASQRKATRRGRGRQPLRSLSDMLKGKQGRFRQNLLGKRVDYSGRSVIIVGPELKLNQCGLPKEMALEMFKPFVLREMILRGVAPNVKSAKNMLERRPPEVFDILEEITKNHPVILNRAPTLHKLSIQAFYPLLIEGSAIRLHPAICSGFNADFDGDQMAVHIPLSKKAINEAINLMLPEKNLLRPADGSPIATPASKEMALGVYYLTSIDPRIKAFDSILSDKEESILAYQSKKIELRQLVTVRLNGEFMDTTVGRILFNESLPSDFGFINEAVTSGIIKQLFSRAYKTKETGEVVEMIDAVKDLGFMGGTVSGLSFGIFDAKVLPEKEKILKEADKRVAEHEKNFAQGLITLAEKKRLIQEVWIEVTEELADKTWEMLDETSPIRIVIDAKVGRASRDQVKQLAAIRGLIVDPLGKIVELPIKSNFREGLSVFEYVTSSRGSRKGLTDTALKTADAGYLTRRLVDVAHDVIIRSVDCGTKDGLIILRQDRPKVFLNRISGRILAEDIKTRRGKVILAKGELLGEDELRKIEEEKVNEVVVRSPLLCQSRYGMCSTCYGRDLSNKDMVEIGTPVGVIAAQSIGEPGTQLTLKTKHSAGIVGLDVTQGLPRVEELFEARTPKVLSPLSEIAGKVRVSEGDEGWKVTVTSTGSRPKEERQYIIPKTIKLAVSDKDLIDSGTPLAQGYLDIKEILSIKGLHAAQEYLVNEIQEVYESQGIAIHDKHFEVTIRRMSDEVRVVTSGDTPLLPGELVGKAFFEEENEKVLAAGGEPASAQQVILGITRRALFTESWLSAASFEQTTDVLTNAAALGREDKLIGLKENVIIGRLIPVTKERAQLPSA
ncbi:DNA-directed RNA polymerase subunit beta' [Candidatus Woesebacteria bacterium RIFCSPLOWO2_01_FULL_39_23]|uniref:DNA-directed RNA polymerase subunit beta' n=2 Tax=Microgenomates group TaxID=1794810 RepID=A0A0H4T7A0_9BACT|nr:DNA-directed RNA polymerase subunit beta', DNA-directed RNA polymerase subunit beta' [uncultured Microgenomates bacterium Rifle_16ft_4_minimus_37633]OGM13865.1 MAG: DNA-directed RNA polymerase subunit beta' [Candidatus Woesebacteria bacterium RBG_16_40_11]OGM27817.1 MAG: DNA-directed RNA polymerase subunit beta' [Candidatus Woesebacteria bacterium RIFCSPHIGHO2_01_FULL_40_22]OGM36073.1 MAG: DNA-directed RNA polymerase subunit beta' [Candidatus Woesebacteria bacterium RIFCSPHIGHO2_12_FULL_38_9]